MNVLHIDSSIFGSQGVSSQLSARLLERLRADGATITSRSFAAQPVPHLDGAHLTALMTPVTDRSAEQQALADYSDTLIAEVQAADLLVIGVPMYNFTVPSMLKSWFDHIARAGVTFRYTENGPEGLIKGKTVYVALARGGLYRDQPHDTQVPYLKTVLGFLGLTDVRFIYAEGLNMGPDAAAKGFAQAEADLAAALA